MHAASVWGVAAARAVGRAAAFCTVLRHETLCQHARAMLLASAFAWAKSSRCLRWARRCISGCLRHTAKQQVEVIRVHLAFVRQR